MNYHVHKSPNFVTFRDKFIVAHEITRPRLLYNLYDAEIIYSPVNVSAGLHMPDDRWTDILDVNKISFTYCTEEKRMKSN